MYLSEVCNIVNAMPPHSTDAGLGGVCAYVNMENYAHFTAVIQSGVGAPAVVTVEKSATGVAAGTAIAFTHRDCNVAYLTAGGNTLGVPTLIVGAGGFTMGANDGNYSVIELDAVELGAAFPFVRLALSAVAGVHSVVYILYGARYKEPGIAVSVV